MGGMNLFETDMYFWTYITQTSIYCEGVSDDKTFQKFPKQIL